MQIINSHKIVIDEPWYAIDFNVSRLMTGPSGGSITGNGVAVFVRRRGMEVRGGIRKVLDNIFKKSISRFFALYTLPLPPFINFFMISFKQNFGNTPTKILLRSSVLWILSRHAVAPRFH